MNPVTMFAVGVAVIFVLTFTIFKNSNNYFGVYAQFVWIVVFGLYLLGTNGY
jgi:hypothetical protein